jgi:hypothetical protein
LYRFKIATLSDEATKSTSYKHISFDVGIVSLKNPPFWSDEAIQSSSYDHVSIDEAIVSLQIRQFEAMKRHSS